MKKLLLSSLTLFLFATSIILFQISCKKEATADTANTNQTGIILFTKSTGFGSTFAHEIWTAAYDGSRQSKVNFTIPSHIQYPIELDAHLSPDGKTIFITFHGDGIYSCDIDGRNMKKIINEGSIEDVR